MKDSTSFEPKMLHPEQVSEQKPDEKPWLRQKQEPAKWFLRFQIYKDLGAKRTLRAAIAMEPETEEATKGDKKQQENFEQGTLSKISVPGSWSRACKVWNWKKRAEAYDLAEQAKEAAYIRNVANKARFASKAYRILQLDWLARTLKQEIECGGTLKDRHAAIARLQSVMRDMAREMEGLDGVTLDACDAAAFKVVREEIQKQGKS